MIYTWRCTSCKAEVDVSRKLDRMHEPPLPSERACADQCEGFYRRIITNPKAVRVQEYEWTDTGKWPV